VVQVHPSRGDCHHAQSGEVHNREGEGPGAVVAVQCLTYESDGIRWDGMRWEGEGVGLI
jgi:hypothetical protein